MQREFIFSKAEALQPGEVLRSVNGKDFEWQSVRGWLLEKEDNAFLPVGIERGSKTVPGIVLVRNYTKRDLLLFIVFPFLISVVFLGFAIFSPFQKISYRRSPQAVEVFSLLCFSVSLFFLGFFPSYSFGWQYPVSLMVPLFGALILHLFLIYPKKKGNAWLRRSVLSGVYVLAFTLLSLRVYFWFVSMPWWFYFLDLCYVGLCLIAALIALANTLFGSADFWARRRARLLSFGFLICFIGIVSAFVAFLWQGPRISWERVLAISIFFPVAFGTVFSKENVFDVERIFKRGLNQTLFIGIAICIAILVGLGWQHWAEGHVRDWILWAVIATVVALLSRPVGGWFESRLGRLLSHRIRYPEVNHIFSKSHGLESFLKSFSNECFENLNITMLYFVFSKDPTRKWSEDNQQQWLYSQGRLVKVYSRHKGFTYRFALKAGPLVFGEISFGGGDGLAFDPLNSRGWENICRDFSRCLELLSLREYLSAQEALLAVGRMQALLAHEMKNPLAVIKVCSGLLQNLTNGSDEADEILRTIQQEVSRISDGVQKVFSHGGRPEDKERLDVYDVVERVKAVAQTRFARSQVQVRLSVDGKPQEWVPGCLFIVSEREGFRQSLLNLLINALEAGAQNVKISFALDSAKYFRIRIEDDGPGLPSEIDLFKPFVTTKPSGTGLGLSQVKSFVDRHAGRIEVESLERGASFCLEFAPDSVNRVEGW